MSTQTKILVDGSSHYIFKHDGILNELPVGNYEFRFGPKGEVWLERQEDLILPEKIYSNDKDFIEHVLKSYKAIDKGLLGVGLVGKKGLGKSFTGNILAYTAKAPIIRLTKSVSGTGFLDVLKQLNQDYILYIDEFEKLFPDSHDNDDQRASQEQLLSFLDGGVISNNKVLFILTSNSDHLISEYIKNRPSRLRYYKSYEELDKEIIKEVLSDLLENEEFLDDLLENLPYSDINLDALVKIIQEVNTHNKAYSTFKDFFNFKETSSMEVYCEFTNSKGEIERVGPLRDPMYSGERMFITDKLISHSGNPALTGTNVSVNLSESEQNIIATPLETITVKAYYTIRDKKEGWKDIFLDVKVIPVNTSLKHHLVF